MIQPLQKKPPTPEFVLQQALHPKAERPIAFVLAGHNGSGKSTLWHNRLADHLQIPLINADRLTTSILPDADENGRLRDWATKLRDDDDRWQRLSQNGVRAFKELVMGEKISFAFETVFSHWKARPDGTFESKADDIVHMQKAGYFVVLLFVGLASKELSMARVATRKAQNGHGVPNDKLIERYPRTQQAIHHAAPIADMTLMFDNSRTANHAFSLCRAQMKRKVLFDIRDPSFAIEPGLMTASLFWLQNVSGPYRHSIRAKRPPAEP